MTNAYEAILITCCEALQVELLDDKNNLINQVLAKDEFSMGYIMGLHAAISLLEQETKKNGLSLKEDIGFDKINLEDFILPK